MKAHTGKGRSFALLKMTIKIACILCLIYYFELSLLASYPRKAFSTTQHTDSVNKCMENVLGKDAKCLWVGGWSGLAQVSNICLPEPPFFKQPTSLK